MNKSYSEDEIKLANEIAYTLDDMDSLQLFLQFTQKYTEDHLRKTLAKVMSLERSKIRKTRGALFTYLIKEHGKRLHTGN
jgi:hypothetical protein